MIINIVIIIKKGSWVNYVMLQGDFALKTSENFNSIFLKTEFADSIDFKQVELSHFLFHQIIHNF